ncbi:YfbM family protein [Paenibacillus paridis]|uniref:YfbM family protein n=1 Tax=Paenibacillus paridis TaxID=2583376 RepID=UPI00111E4346|nr:YfbM family protein [Paenibacillus paridis]
MGMTGYLQQVSMPQLQELLARLDELNGVIVHEDFDVEALDIDKAWHAIHFMLNGSSFDGEEPLLYTILGGTPVGADEGHGPARYLTDGQVRAVAEELSQINNEELDKRFDPEQLSAEGIYPSGSEWNDEEDKEYVLSYFHEVANYYTDAASKGYGMILYMM